LDRYQWKNESVNLSDFVDVNPVRIAFVHLGNENSTNVNKLKLDGIQVIQPDIRPENLVGFRIYRNYEGYGEMILPNILSSTVQLIYGENIISMKKIYNISDEYIESPFSNTIYVNGTTNENEIITLTKNTILHNNYPNPFNPSTTIQFTVGNELLSKESFISIDIFNIKGQRVKTLISGYYPTGTHSVVWNGDDINGKQVSSGLYFYRMIKDDFSSIKKMILMK
jgi:hypothetical protein